MAISFELNIEAGRDILVNCVDNRNYQRKIERRDIGVDEIKRAFVHGIKLYYDAKFRDEAEIQRRFHDRAKNQRHNIKNNIPVGSIEFVIEDFSRLENLIDKDQRISSLCKDINENLRFAFKHAFLTQIFNFEAFKEEGENDHPLLDKNTPLELTRFLSTIHASQVPFEIVVEDGYEDILLDNVQIEHTFNLLYNLYANAEFSVLSSGCDVSQSDGVIIHFSIDTEGNRILSVTNPGFFKNTGALDYLLGQVETHPQTKAYKKRGWKLFASPLVSLDG